MTTTHSFKTMRSPVGEIKLVASDKGLASILWEDDDETRVRLGPMKEDANHPLLLEAERQLNEYFAGKLKKFSLTLDFVGTEFQKQVWNALLTIPYGETRSYGEIAAQIGNPKAVRAVGGANGRNPISIIAPCHRVIGANGKLTGFAGGLEAKSCLLKIEGITGTLRKSRALLEDKKSVEQADCDDLFSVPLNPWNSHEYKIPQSNRREGRQIQDRMLGSGV